MLFHRLVSAAWYKDTILTPESLPISQYEIISRQNQKHRLIFPLQFPIFLPCRRNHRMPSNQFGQIFQYSVTSPVPRPTLHRRIYPVPAGENKRCTAHSKSGLTRSTRSVSLASKEPLAFLSKSLYILTSFFQDNLCSQRLSFRASRKEFTCVT
jgi:hypothetical protein